MHELATNAVKYGALSVPHGSVEIQCRRPGDAPAMATFRWRERGGPAVAPPRRSGFGSRLIERSAKYDLNGTAAMTYRPDGIECVIHFALDDPDPGKGGGDDDQ